MGGFSWWSLGLGILETHHLEEPVGRGLAILGAISHLVFHATMFCLYSSYCKLVVLALAPVRLPHALHSYTIDWFLMRKDSSLPSHAAYCSRRKHLTYVPDQLYPLYISLTDLPPILGDPAAHILYVYLHGYPRRCAAEFDQINFNTVTCPFILWLN